MHDRNNFGEMARVVRRRASRMSAGASASAYVLKNAGDEGEVSKESYSGNALQVTFADELEDAAFVSIVEGGSDGPASPSSPHFLSRTTTPVASVDDLRYHSKNAPTRNSSQAK